MSTFLAITQDLYDRLGHTQIPPTIVQRRLKRFVNTWHRRVVSLNGMAPLRRVILTHASVANQAEYGIVLNSIKAIRDPLNSPQTPLIKQPLSWYRAHFNPPSNSGTPRWWVPLGTSRIHTRPTAASELFIVSSNAADVGTVKIEAIRSRGYRVSLSHVLTGIVPVSLDALITDVVDVVDVYLSAAQLGTVTVTQGSGGIELSRIPIGQTFPRFLRFALAPTPSAVITYTIDGEADIVDMANDTDEPLVPIDFHDILIMGALADEYQQLGKPREAQLLLNGGSPNSPTPNSVEGRIRRLRASLAEFTDGDDLNSGWPYWRSFDDTIHEPIL